MVLVDTTVWIDFFSDRNKPHVAMLQELIENEEDLCLCGVILAEVLQGIRSDTDFTKTKGYKTIYFPAYAANNIFTGGGDLQIPSKEGITIRKPVDCMIASVAIEYDIPLLHNDRDFDHIAKHSKLRIYG